MSFYKRVFVILILLFINICVHAQSSSELFRKANELRELGKWEEAIEMYTRTKELDSNYVKDCDYWIEHILIIIDSSKDELRLSSNVLDIPYQGGTHEVIIYTDDVWSATCEASWLSIKKVKDDILQINCDELNPYVLPRTAFVKVLSGSRVENITVTQAGAPEYLFASSNTINFLYTGGQEYVAIESNSDWIVSSRPSWCIVEKNANGVNILIDPNTDIDERKGDIIISTLSGISNTIRVSQSASEFHAEFSKNTLHFSDAGGVDTIKVYSDNRKWRIMDYPYWCSAKMVSDSLIVVYCVPNEPIGQPREGGVKIALGNTSQVISIYQELKPKPEYTPIAKLVQGRDFSFGLSTSYVIPIVSAKSSSEFTLSAVNYSLGDQREQVAYQSKGGFSIGAYMDARIYKNLYITPTVYYTRYSYQNKFDEFFFRRCNWNGTLIEGNTANIYHEDYQLNYVDVSLPLSYRLPLGTKSFFGINAGLVVSKAFNSRMKLNGNTTSSFMDYVGIVGDTGDNGWHYSLEGDLDLLAANGLYTVIYTGDDQSSIPIIHPADILSAPLKSISFGSILGVSYEYRGFAISIDYYAMLNNIANSKFWDSERFEIFTFGSDVLMSGYKQRNHRLQITLSYTLRYL